jgi:hypothetical protein
MNEITKTVVFFAVAVFMGCVYLVGRPKDAEYKPGDGVGEVLFEKLNDPSAAASMSILKYDEELGELDSFEVEKNGRTGLWTIPSHADYPADAEDRIRDVATSFVGLKALGVATSDPAEHAMYGVGKPEQGMSVGEQGVGMLVHFEDAKGKVLASLIIGESIKGAEGHRFVREPERDVVYDVEIDPDRFSTKFEDWIEADLLDINALDVSGITIKDYSVINPRITLRGQLDFDVQPRFDAAVTWNSADNKWELDDFTTYRPDTQEPQSSQLLEGEELNSDRLNELKNSLDDLKIVDIRRKPEGMRDGSKAEAEFLKDQEALNSLLDRGIYPRLGEERQLELLCASGEVRIEMKDGYYYLLRFGRVSGTEEESEESKLNRFLLVTTAVNESQFPMPEVEPVPKKQEAPAPPADTGGEAEAKEDAADADGEQDAGEGEQKAEPEPKEEKSELDKEIERIEKENQRKIDERDEKRNKAVEKVYELNGRFAEWYYVVSEDVYKKIRLSRGDLIKEVEQSADDGFGVDAFRKLQGDGLKEAEAPTGN